MALSTSSFFIFPQPLSYPLATLGTQMRALLITFLILNLSACVPLYFPPVPSRDREPMVDQIDIGNSAGVRLRGERLELSLQLNAVPDEGWLAVQWYSPKNVQVASDALWVGKADAGLGRLILLPGDIEVVPGQWRAVVSFESNLLRQFSLTIPEQEPASDDPFGGR